MGFARSTTPRGSRPRARRRWPSLPYPMENHDGCGMRTLLLRRMLRELASGSAAHRSWTLDAKADGVGGSRCKLHDA